MLPIGPFVLCSMGGVSTRLAVSVLQCCVVWVRWISYGRTCGQAVESSGD